jgi:hypothetical protein
MAETFTLLKGASLDEINQKLAAAQAAANSIPAQAFKQAVEAATGGKNTVLYDESGNASVMVRIPAFTLDEIDPSLGSGLHPAFIVDGVEKSEIYIGKYLASLAGDGLAVSLPGVDPKTSINFNAADAACSGKGAGWHMMTNAEWSALALWSWKNETMPRGNAAYGRSYVYGHETGVRQDGGIPGESSGTARTLTGTGPATWNHDFTDSGIADLCGNVWEWQRGYRIVDSEIQIIPDNDAAATGADNSGTSALWKAILPDGSLVDPGTAGTLKWDSGVNLNTSAPSSGTPSSMYKDISAASGVSVPALLKVLGIFPHDTTIDRGRAYINVEGERMPRRGGRWSYGGNAGVFACALSVVRSHSDSLIGFRPAFVI